MLVKAFKDFKEGKSLDEIADEIKKVSDQKTKFRRKSIRPFEDFLNDKLKNTNEPLNEMKYLTGREKYVTENNAHAQKVLDKLNTKDLPEAEGLDSKLSQVGSFISSDEIVELYGDDFEGILDRLGENGMLVYSWGNTTTWWQRKIDSDGDGLVRVE